MEKSGYVKDCAASLRKYVNQWYWKRYTDAERIKVGYIGEGWFGYYLEGDEWVLVVLVNWGIRTQRFTIPTSITMTLTGVNGGFGKQVLCDREAIDVPEEELYEAMAARIITHLESVFKK